MEYPNVDVDAWLFEIQIIKNPAFSFFSEQ